MPSELPPDGENPSLPDEVQIEHQLTRFMQAASVPAVSPVERAVARKLTPEHITQLLDYKRKQEENRHSEQLEANKFVPTLCAVVIGLTLLFVLGLAWLAMAYGKSEVLIPVLSGMVGLAGAAWGGYGLGRAKKKSAREAADDAD